MPREALLENDAGTLEDLRIEVVGVVHDDHDGRTASQEPARIHHRPGNRVDVGSLRGLGSAAHRWADLVGAPILEAEQLVGVAVLLVVVDQALDREVR